ncbi:alpha-L-rhamnosidase-related protein [Lactiplantibacillus plantarum]|uniref:alpha-L-rhamnosidase-related protein n=1 Tax=Lactiplantibacillus plantarum TaxID=1590 RepID=UPI0015CF4507|nr:alpha-rhamnosidase [Lactiplantibacillus plantarum]
MTVTFSNEDDHKFHKLTDQCFTANPKLLTKASISVPLTTRTIQPRRYLVVTKINQATLATATWQPVTGAIALHKHERLIYDLGALYVGHFQVAIDVAGSPMDASLLMRTRFAEQLQELSVDASRVTSWLPTAWIQDDTRHVELLPTTVQFERRYSCRYIMLEPVGQSLKWQPVLADAEFRAASAVLKQAVQPFSNDPPELYKIDQVCLETLRNTMQTVFEDGTKRDRRLWLLDFRMQAKVDYVTFKHMNLARRCLYLFGAFSDQEGRLPADILTRTKIPVADDLYWFDYQLQFIMAVAEYIDATRDRVVLNDLYPVVKRSFEFIKVQLTTGLTVGQRADVFVDWSTNCNKEAAVQGILVQAMKAFLKLALQWKDPDVNEIQAWIEDLKIATIKEFYDSDKDVFISGPNQEVNLLAQIQLLLANVLPSNEQQRALQQLLHDFDFTNTAVTPSTEALLAEVLLQNGQTKVAIDIIRQYWGAMVANGADTFWEVFDQTDANYSPYGSILLNSYCFGWSCYPAYLLRTYLSDT